MILSLESYSAVIIRLDLSRDCPPYDPVTPPQTTRTKLSFSFAIVPTYWAAAYLFIIIIIMIVIMIILCLVCIVCANAPAPSQLRLRTMPSLAVREISLSQLSVQSFEYSTEIFDCCRIDLSLCWATNSPQLMITMFILCDGWRVATMPKRIEDVEMVTTETDREARDRER